MVLFNLDENVEYLHVDYDLDIDVKKGLSSIKIKCPQILMMKSKDSLIHTISHNTNLTLKIIESINDEYFNCISTSYQDVNFIIHRKENKWFLHDSFENEYSIDSPF
jgi:hypothetical protein